MAPVSDYSTTAADNTSISGITVSDATLASQLDNIIRQVMADVKAADDANAKLAAAGTSGTRASFDSSGELIGTYAPAYDRLGRTAASNDSAIGFLSQIDNTIYDHYILWCSALVPSSDGAVLRLRLSLNGSTYDSGSADYGWGRQDMESLAAAPAYTASGASSNALQITPQLGSDITEYGFSGQIHIYGAHETKFPRVQWSGVGANLSETETGIQGYGRRNAVGPVLGMQLSFNAGNIESGQVTLIGVRKT